mgnify:CR=1 FL=1
MRSKDSALMEQIHSYIDEYYLREEEAPSTTDIAREFSISRSSAYRYLVAMAEKKLIGYADGIPRSLSCGKGFVLIKGRRAPIAGRICMDQLLVDVTDLPKVKRGDEVVLLGRQRKRFPRKRWPDAREPSPMSCSVDWEAGWRGCTGRYWYFQFTRAIRKTASAMLSAAVAAHVCSYTGAPFEHFSRQIFMRACNLPTEYSSELEIRY